MATGTAAFFAALFKTNDPIHVNKINHYNLNYKRNAHQEIIANFY